MTRRLASLLLRREFLPRAGYCALVLASALAVLAPMALPGEEKRAWLSWRNGDELTGQILPSTDGQIRWSATPFAKPLNLRINQLDRIRFSSPGSDPESEESDDRYRVHLLNGDRLHGRLLAIDRDTVSLECHPFEGPIRIRRDRVERVVHIDSDYLRYSGPDDLPGWSSVGRDRKPTEWFTDLRGAFATHQWSGNLFRPIAFPNAVEIRFSAEIPGGEPNLEIGLVRDAVEGPMLETWDNYLVLTHHSRFVPIYELDGEIRKLEFRLFWNQETGDLRLCEPSGRHLASLQNVKVDRPEEDDERDPLMRGFSILNRTPELRLLALSVQEWDGSEPDVIDLSRPRVVLAGFGHRFQVADVSLPEGSRSLRVGRDSFELGRMRELVLSPPAAEGSQPDPATVSRIAWYDGSTVSGDFEALADDSLSLRPAWTEEPLVMNLRRAREIRFPEPGEAAVEGSDVLSGDGFHVGGTARWMPGEEGSSLVGWLAPGADEPVPLADDLEAQVTRAAHPSTAPAISSVIGQGRVHLRNGEVLAGSLISITRDKVHFTSRVTGQVAIPAEEVEAIDIGTVGRVLEGFGDSEWEEIEKDQNEVESTDENIVLRGGSFGNPSLLLGDQVHFTAEWKKNYGAMTIRLFADGPGTSPSTDIIVAAQGNRLFIGRLKETGAFSFSGDQIPIVDSKAQFEIRAQPHKIEVIVNGKSSLDIEVDTQRVSGNGIYFKMGGGWQGWNQNDNEILISDFRIGRSPGSVPRRVIDPEAKLRALTVPRSRRDPVPTHVILAPNGDLLRGSLEAATSDSLRFTSKGESFDLPYSRVAAVVWLRGGQEEASEPEGEGSEPSEPAPVDSGRDDFKPTHQFTLMDGSRLLLAGRGIENRRFVGESSILGKCTLAIENVHEMRRDPLRAGAEFAVMNGGDFAGWELQLTPEPSIPSGDDPSTSPLVGKEAPDFELALLDDSKFKLSDYKGRVVVLDFWASWCGPCIKAIPDVRAAAGAFPPDQVVLCAINQGETTPIITNFLANRGWEGLTVGLDFAMEVGKSYGAESLPQTVVIARDGTVAAIHTGYSEDLKEKLFESILEELRE